MQLLKDFLTFVHNNRINVRCKPVHFVDNVIIEKEKISETGQIVFELITVNNYKNQWKKIQGFFSVHCSTIIEGDDSKADLCRYFIFPTKVKYKNFELLSNIKDGSAVRFDGSKIRCKWRTKITKKSMKSLSDIDVLKNEMLTLKEQYQADEIVLDKNQFVFITDIENFYEEIKP